MMAAAVMNDKDGSGGNEGQRQQQQLRKDNAGKTMMATMLPWR